MNGSRDLYEYSGKSLSEPATGSPSRRQWTYRTGERRIELLSLCECREIGGGP